MPKTGRLNRNQIQEIVEKGRKIHSPFFSFIYVNSPKTKKFAISVPKKDFPGAVCRNKYKRWAKEVLRTTMSSLPPCSVLIVLRKELKNKDFSEFSTLLLSEIKKISL